MDFEKEAWRSDCLCCGIDEVGRGCIAGPVVAAAVIFPPNHKIHKKIRDSKKMTPKMRQVAFEYILDNSIDFGVGLINAQMIDKIGIVSATEQAIIESVKMLKTEIDHALIDGKSIKELNLKQKAVVKGDEHIYSISAASIVAKVFRDAIVSGFDNVYEDYNFKSHKGYGTKKHFEAITKNGLTPEHRKTFLKNGDKHYHTI